MHEKATHVNEVEAGHILIIFLYVVSSDQTKIKQTILIVNHFKNILIKMVDLEITFIKKFHK